MPIGDFDIALYTLGGVGKMNYDLSWLMHQLHLTKKASNMIGFISSSLFFCKFLMLRTTKIGSL